MALRRNTSNDSNDVWKWLCREKTQPNERSKSQTARGKIDVGS